MVCFESHKATEKKFPFTKWAEREILVNGKKEKERYIEGYICRKCILKDLRKKNAGKV
jgi:hypothetical protein